jgi:hypothetical protein
MEQYKVMMEKEYTVTVVEECEGCGVYFVPSDDGTKCEDCLQKEEKEDDPWEKTDVA